ncbi:hypothetical protein Q1M64_06020 (plasmid) [Sinorhizobium meliloti]|nr:hypothetical protein Q1M64_06020 [Sinorhizobium meliloti]
MGAYLNKVRKELGIASRLIASLTALTKFGVLSLDGLEPGSPFLTQLMEDSSKELANGWDAQVKARQVIFWGWGKCGHGAALPGGSSAHRLARAWTLLRLPLR